MRDTRIRDKVIFSKGVMRTGSPGYARSFEGAIAGNLGDVADRLREAAGSLTENGSARSDRTLERARELVRGLESLRQRIADRTEPGAGQPPGSGSGATEGQPGQQPSGANALPGGRGRQGGRLSPGEVRQFSREFGLRRQAADSLRRELAGQNLEAAGLGRVIDDLRRLESGRPFADPKGLEELQRAVVEGLKSWEFKLWRTLDQGRGGKAALGGSAEAPPAYRTMVEEYYRSLARRPGARPRPER